MADTKSLPPGMRDPARRALSNAGVKDRINIEKYGAETDGEYSQIRVWAYPNGGTPIHQHTSYREELTAVTNTLGVLLGTSTLLFKPGETVVIPIGTKHRFFNPSGEETVEFIGRVVPAHEGFEKSVHIIYGLAEDGECDTQGLPKSFMQLCLMADLGDMRWPGMMAMANPLIKAVAAYARWSGEEERLLKRYWY